MPLCSSQKGLGLKTRCQSNFQLKNRSILQRGFGCFESVCCWNTFKTKGWCPKCNSTFLLWLSPFLYSHQRLHDAPSSSQLVHWFQNPLNCTFNLGGSFFHLPAPEVFYCMHSCDCSSIWHSPTWVFSLRLQGKKAAHTIVSPQSIKALVSRRGFWWDHIMISTVMGNRAGTACHLKSQPLRTEAVLPSHLICRDADQCIAQLLLFLLILCWHRLFQKALAKESRKSSPP